MLPNWQHFAKSPHKKAKVGPALSGFYLFFKFILGTLTYTEKKVAVRDTSFLVPLSSHGGTQTQQLPKDTPKTFWPKPERDLIPRAVK
jgi:hypothetical protein